MNWDWKKDTCNSREKTKYCCTIKYGQGIVDSLLEEKPWRRSIPQEGKLALASLAQLDVYEFSHWASDVKIDAKTDGIDISVWIENIWLTAQKESWKWESESSYGAKELIFLVCKGWKCTPALLKKVREKRITLADIPRGARKILAKKVELNENEFDYWAQELSVTEEADGFRVRIGVPNIWICADLFQGGTWYWDKPIWGTAGLFGRLPSVLFTWRQKVIYCNTFKELLETLTEKRGKVWGMVLFAHGSRDGRIWENTNVDDSRNWQFDIMRKLDSYRYKLARINMMQCYSGYQGTFVIPLRHMAYVNRLSGDKNSDTWKKEKIENYFRKKYKEFDDSADVEITVVKEISTEGQEVFRLGVRVTINWAGAWFRYGEKITLYRYVNTALLDIDWSGLWEKWNVFE